MKYSDFVNRVLKYVWYEEQDKKDPQHNFLIKGLQKILKTSIRLINAFRGYIYCLLNNDPIKKDDHLAYLVNYLIPYVDVVEMETEFLRLIKNRDFRTQVEVTLGLSQATATMEMKMKALDEIFKMLNNKHMVVAFNLLTIHPFG